MTLLDADLLGLHVNVFIHVSLEKQVEEALQHFEAAISDRHFAVVTHPFVIRAAILHALAANTASFNLIDVEPLSVVDLRFNERWRLRV